MNDLGGPGNWEKVVRCFTAAGFDYFKDQVTMRKLKSRIQNEQQSMGLKILARSARCGTNALPRDEETASRYSCSNKILALKERRTIQRGA